MTPTSALVILNRLSSRADKSAKEDGDHDIALDTLSNFIAIHYEDTP